MYFVWTSDTFLNIKILIVLYFKVANEVCWEEPREICTEQKMKVAKKWCVEDDNQKKGFF